MTEHTPPHQDGAHCHRPCIENSPTNFSQPERSRPVQKQELQPEIGPFRDKKTEAQGMVVAGACGDMWR